MVHPCLVADVATPPARRQEARIMTEDAARTSKPEPPADTSAHASVVAVYDSHEAAEAAVRTLAASGFDMKTLSIVGRDHATEDGVVGYYQAGDRVRAWGKRGAFWGGLWALFLGSALFVIPGVGPLFAAGPVVAWIVAALEGATMVGGMSALAAGLYHIGIPKDHALAYETQIKAGKFVVIAHGTREQVDQSKTILVNAERHDGKPHGCCA
jgi:hypothetical protein